MISKINKIKTRIELIKKAFLSLKNPDVNLKNKEFDILLFGDDSRNIKIDLKEYQPLMDSVRDELDNGGFKCLYIDTPFSSQNFALAWGLSGAINRTYFIACLRDFISRSSYKYRTSIYDKIIKTTSTKCVIMFNAPIPLCQAAHQNKIPSIELLHGIGYFKIPWGLENRLKKSLPTHILSMDKTSTKSFSDLKKKDVEIIQIANPFIKRFILPDLTNSLPKEWTEPFHRINNRKLIIISLQWGYSGEYKDYTGIIPNGILYEEFDEIFKQTKDKIFWGIRLHPIQLDKIRYSRHIAYVESLARIYENIDWQWFTYKPLPTILKNASGHVTMSSMTTYEAAYMGIPTLALCPTLQPHGIYQNFFQELIEKNFIEKNLFNIDEVLNWSIRISPKEPLEFVQRDSVVDLTKLLKSITTPQV